MAQAYGSAFVSQFGDTPNDMWAAGLAPFDLVEINSALGRLITGGGEYTPNLATVIGEIRAAQGHWEHRRIEAANIPTLPPPTALNYEQAKPYLERMKEICNA